MICRKKSGSLPPPNPAHTWGYWNWSGSLSPFSLHPLVLMLVRSCSSVRSSPCLLNFFHISSVLKILVCLYPFFVFENIYIFFIIVTTYHIHILESKISSNFSNLRSLHSRFSWKYFYMVIVQDLWMNPA